MGRQVFKAHRGETKGGLLLTTIFNLMIDTVVVVRKCNRQLKEK